MNKKLPYAFAASLSLSLVACGDDDDKSDDSTPTTSAADSSTTTAASSTTTAAVPSVDWAAISTNLTNTLRAELPAITTVEASRDGGTVTFQFETAAVGDTPDDPAGFVMRSVAFVRRNFPQALDGVEDVAVQISGEGGTLDETYTLRQVETWIRAAGL